MKKIINSILCLMLTLTSYSQAPQGVNYQSVIRNSVGLILSNQQVGVKFNIRQGSASGTVVYSEKHTTSTNQFGLVNLVIGQGTAISGNFSSINWGGGSYFTEILVDATGGSNFISMGTQQLMSVPYALYANKTNESQTLSISGNNLTISNGNTVSLPISNTNSAGYSTKEVQIPDEVATGNYCYGPGSAYLTSEPDGSVVYLALSQYCFGAYTTAIIVLKRDVTTGEYVYFNRVNVGCSIITPLLVMGNYLYIYQSANTQCGIASSKIMRYDKNNLATLPVQMSIVGATPSGNVMFTDATYLYAYDNSNTVFKKYSVSGTTLTDQGAYLLPNMISAPRNLVNDATGLLTTDGTTFVSLSMTGSLLGSYTNTNFSTYDDSFVMPNDNNSIYKVMITFSPTAHICTLKFLPLRKP